MDLSKIIRGEIQDVRITSLQELLDTQRYLTGKLLGRHKNQELTPVGRKRGRCNSWWRDGKRYASVFPEPVRAFAKTSFPERAKGMAFSWIRVGLVIPCFVKTRNSLSSKPNSLNVLTLCSSSTVMENV